MKTHDREEDRELQLFFTELKEQDERLPIPDFPGLPNRQRNRWIPLGIAATLAALLWFYRHDPPVPQPERDVIVITLLEGENQEQQLLIEKTTALDSWQPQSSSLLTEF